MLITMATVAGNHRYIGSASSLPHQGSLKPVVEMVNLRQANSALKTLAKAAKRRSAVERLEASKANYVKSEKVLDAKQELRHSSHLKVSSIVPSFTNNRKQQQPNNYKKPSQQNGNIPNGYYTLHHSRPSHALPPKSPGLSHAKSKPEIFAKSDFQKKLRRLISSRDNSSESESSQACGQQEATHNLHKSMPDLNKANDNSSCYRLKSDRCHRATSDYVSRSPSCPQEHDSCSSESGTCEPAFLSSLSKRKPIMRSKSDISYRYSKEPYNETFKKIPKCNPEVERFFNSMGLDVSELSTLRNNEALGESILSGSFSSIDSDVQRSPSICDDDDASDANTCGRSGLKNSDLKQNGPSETSIIEKNARIIKWLFNCRKSQDVQK